MRCREVKGEEIGQVTLDGFLPRAVVVVNLSFHAAWFARVVAFADHAMLRRHQNAGIMSGSSTSFRR